MLKHVLMEGAGDGGSTGGNAGGAAGGAAASGAGSAGAASGGAGDSGAGAAAAPAWHGYSDPADVAYLANKGWQGPQDVIKSYRNAEQLIGKNPDQLLVLPRADDPAGFRSVLQKLGLPESPDKYEFAKTEGVTPDAGYEAWARNTFHELGLLPDQVKNLTAKHNEYVKAQLTKQAQDAQLRVQTEKSDLVREWGAGHERMINAAKTAANALGFTGDVIDAIEAKVGYKGTMKLFAALGQKLGEDGFVGGKSNGAGGGLGTQLTPAEAKAQWDAMRFDPVQSKALVDASHPQHKSAKEKQQRLMSIMYPA